MPDQFYDLTIGEILRYSRAHRIRESKQWEHSRFIAWFGSLPYQKKGSNVRQEDIMELITDPTEEEREIMRKEQQAKEQEAYQLVLETYRQMGYNV